MYLTHDMVAVHILLTPEIRVWNTPDAGAIHPPEEEQQVRDCECPFCRVISKGEPSVIPLHRVL